MMRITGVLTIAALTFVLYSHGSGEAQTSETIGHTSAIQPNASGTLPSGSVQVLRLGNDVYRDERVKTDSNGRVQLLFVDGTSISVPPNDLIVLNLYRFNLQTRTGKFAANLLSGAVRATAGALGDVPGGIEVRIGDTQNKVGLQAGADVAIIRSPDNSASILSLTNGLVVVTNSSGDTRTIARSAFRVDVSATGTLSAPIRASVADISNFMDNLQGKSGTGQRASDQTLNAIGRQNSSLSINQLSPNQTGFSAKPLDAQDLDVLSGLAPPRLGDLNQRTFIGTLPTPLPTVPNMIAPPTRNSTTTPLGTPTATPAETPTPTPQGQPAPVGVVILNRGG